MQTETLRPILPILLAACLLLLAVPPAPAVERIVVPHVIEGDHRPAYHLALLRLALDKTVDEYGEYELAFYPTPTEQARDLRMIEERAGIDLTWTMTSTERERHLLPIRIPLQKGLLGYRIFIIRPNRADTLARVTSLSELSGLTAVQGHDWPDTSILRHNGLRVSTCSHYPQCFDMLAAGRVDYFPRGVIEPWAEIKERPELDLTVEQTIVLRYPAPIYFFVERNNRTLARRIETGLRAALADGSFDRVFYTHPHTRQALDKARLGRRTVFDLDNPLLPPDTPLDDPSLWIDLNRLP